jgi:hypothetical protein
MLTYHAAANPKCPKGIMQWQHGSFSKQDNGSLVMVPIAVDGRQVYSDPCAYKNSIYTRYNASELFKVCPLISNVLHFGGRQLTCVCSAEVRSSCRWLHQQNAPQPLQIRRLSPHPALPRIFTSKHAAYLDAEPVDDEHGRWLQSYIQS